MFAVSPEAAAASWAGLRKLWKGVVRFRSSLLVHFKLSNSRQQKYGVINQKDGASQHRLGEFMNEFLSGYTQILDLP